MHATCCWGWGRGPHPTLLFVVQKRLGPPKNFPPLSRLVAAAIATSGEGVRRATPGPALVEGPNWMRTSTFYMSPVHACTSQRSQRKSQRKSQRFSSPRLPTLSVRRFRRHSSSKALAVAMRASTSHASMRPRNISTRVDEYQRPALVGHNVRREPSLRPHTHPPTRGNQNTHARACPSRPLTQPHGRRPPVGMQYQERGPLSAPASACHERT